MIPDATHRERPRSRLKKALEDFFVPGDLRHDRHIWRRAVETVYIAPILSGALLVFAAGHVFVDETLIGPKGLVILALLALLIPFISKATKRSDAATYFGTALIVFAAVWYMIGYGGMISPQGVMLAIVPGAIYYLAGPRAFWVWLLIILLVLSGVFYLTATGFVVDPFYYDYFPHPKNGMLLYDYAMVTSGVIIMYSFIVFLIERERERTELELVAAKQSAENALEQLQQAQDQLVEQEKMVALGELVAGMSHEVNTPIGNALTAASHLFDETRMLEKQFHDNTLRKADFEKYMDRLNETTRIVLGNIDRASALINSFKNIAVDQSANDIRKFNLADYIGDVILSLKPTVDRAGHLISVNCPPDIEIENNPGAFSQILTNFVMNSVLHAYPKGKRGYITITVKPEKGDGMTLIYSDDGAGIPEEHMSKIFDPFFTTKRGEGGSGLGLNVVFNLAMHTLKGQLSVDSKPGKGTKFTLFLPRKNLQPPEKDRA